MDQKVKNNLDATDLKAILNALFGDKSNIGAICKLEQNIMEL
jgi:hypothetical protein